MRTLFCVVMIGMLSNVFASVEDYKNPNLPIDQRVKSLVSQMTLEEKVSQMSHLAPAIERLGIAEYGPNFKNTLILEKHPDYSDEEFEEYQRKRPWENPDQWEQGDCLDGGWWNEALHGVARSGKATVFPQSIGLGSTWNPDIVRDMADVASTEARIHNLVYGKKLTFWSPTINILRDPRWGRSEESYSEDPYLLAQMAKAFVEGFQGDHPKYFKAIATPKHFVANNSEYNRHTGSSDVTERFLREYYLYAFKAAIKDAGAFSTMSAYNAVNGIPVTADPWLLTDILRGEWGFRGYVVSDCGAVSDIVHGHHFEKDPEKAVALAVIAGTDLECETCETEQFLYDKYLLNAVKKGYISEDVIDLSVTRLFRARMKLGEFDPPEMVPFNKIPVSKLDSPEHRQLALQAARESIILLKNDNITLPLDKSKVGTTAVIGPNADRAEFGGYSGTPTFRVTPLDGIRSKIGAHNVYYEMGCQVDSLTENGFEKAVNAAKQSDQVILVLGTNLDLANEAKDRQEIGLPQVQVKLAKAVYEANPNIILVLINGNSLSINWMDENVPAIIEAWYPGQSGGTAIADVLFGDYNPAGRLPVTVYKSIEQLADLGDYDITKGRTYWFLKDEPLYKFGHGLSYTTFEYEKLNLPRKVKNGKDFEVSVKVTNTGDRDGDEVVQLYVTDLEASVKMPKRKLQGFERIHLEKGQTKTVTFTLSPVSLAFVNNDGKWMVEPGDFLVSVGGRQPNEAENSKGSYNDLVVGKITVTGIDYIIN